MNSESPKEPEKPAWLEKFKQDFLRAAMLAFFAWLALKLGIPKIEIPQQQQPAVMVVTTGSPMPPQILTK